MALLACVILLGAFCAQPLRAQSAELDGLASKLLEKIEQKDHKKIIVADFIGPGGKLNEFGRDLADQFSAALGRAGKSVQLLPRNNLVASWNGSLDIDRTPEIEEGRAARALARRARAEVVVTGTLRSDADAIELRAKAWEIPEAFGRSEVWDPEKFADASVRLVLTPEMSQLLKKELPPPGPGTARMTAGLRPGVPFNPHAAPASAAKNPALENIARPGRNGVGWPTCLECPRPEPSEEARQKKAEGLVLLDVTVTPDGRAESIVVLRSPGYGLDQKAVEAVSRWKFKPANGPDGKPVAVRVQIEVSFHFL